MALRRSRPPSPHRPSDVIGDVEHLLRSPTRVRVLRLLADRGTVHRDALKAEFDVARTTLQRNLDALEDRGWVRNTGVEYRISPCGRLVARALGDVLDTTLTAVRVQEVLQWVPASDLDLDVGHLDGAEVVRSAPADPFAPVTRYAEALHAADRARVVVTAANLQAVADVAEHAPDDGVAWDLVVTGDGVDAIRAADRHESTLSTLAGAGAVNLRIADETVPFYLGLLDGTVHLGAADDDGIPRGLLVSASGPLREWATGTFERVWEAADPFESPAT